MNLNKKILFSSFLVPTCLSFSPFVISCTNNEGENIKNEGDNTIVDDEITNEKPPIPNVDDQNEIGSNFKTKIAWLQGFRNKKPILNNVNNNFMFTTDEIILDTKTYTVSYVNCDDNNVPCYSIYDKKISKYYLASLDCSYEYLNNNFSKIKIKEFVYTKLIEDYEKNMIINHVVSDSNFFIPIDISDESIKYVDNQFIDFMSSWGVWNHQTKNVIYEINITNTKIREMLFGSYEQNYDNLIINEVEATDLYLLPKLLIMDDPINYFESSILSIKDNNVEKYLDLTEDEKSILKIDLPGSSDLGEQHWVGTVNNQNVSGRIVPTEYVGGISSSIITLLNSNSSQYDNLIDRVNLSSRDKVKKYVKSINVKGKRISINSRTKFNNTKPNNTFSLNVHSTISSGANSANLFGDGSKACIYNIEAIQKMKVNFVEYKKF